MLGVCHVFLQRQTIWGHLRRSRPETVPAALPPRRRAQTWCDVFVAPAPSTIPEKERVLARLGWAVS